VLPLCFVVLAVCMCLFMLAVLLVHRHSVVYLSFACTSYTYTSGCYMTLSHIVESFGNLFEMSELVLLSGQNLGSLMVKVIAAVY